jgi:glycine hydroxymethyltransferase
MKLNTSAIFCKPEFYELDPKTETIDFNSVRAQGEGVEADDDPVRVQRVSADHRLRASSARSPTSVGALLFADIAHIAGLVAAACTRRRSARARRHDDDAQDAARPARRAGHDQRRRAGEGDQPQRLPGSQGGPLMHIIAAKASRSAKRFARSSRATRSRSSRTPSARRRA